MAAKAPPAMDRTSPAVNVTRPPNLARTDEAIDIAANSPTVDPVTSTANWFAAPDRA